MPSQPNSFDVIVIGAGIAGASVAAEISRNRKVALLEMEAQPGYHTTGRSAAIFSGRLGGPVVGALSFASGHFLANPPEGFSDVPLIAPRGVLMIARQDQKKVMNDALAISRPGLKNERLEAPAALEKNPLLRSTYVDSALWNESATDIDVHALHSGFLRQLRVNDGQLFLNAAVRSLSREGDRWRVKTAQAEFDAEILVNAAGAWADEIATMAGVPQIGLTPMRRTAMLVEPPAGKDISQLPMTIDIEEQFYLKPDAGNLLISPADETPMTPHDAQPEELDIAICVDRITSAFDIEIRHIKHKWAGLRTFATDRAPVVGFDPAAKNFFWLAGQGGFGIQTSPAMAAIAGALLNNNGVPAEITDAGLDLDAILPDRWRQK